MVDIDTQKYNSHAYSDRISVLFFENIPSRFFSKKKTRIKNHKPACDAKKHMSHSKSMARRCSKPARALTKSPLAVASRAAICACSPSAPFRARFRSMRKSDYPLPILAVSTIPLNCRARMTLHPHYSFAFASIGMRSSRTSNCLPSPSRNEPTNVFPCIDFLNIK